MVRLLVMAEEEDMAAEGTAEAMATLLDLEANPPGGRLAIHLAQSVLCTCIVCTTSSSFSLSSILYIPLLSISPNRYSSEGSRCFSTGKRGATALWLNATTGHWASGRHCRLTAPHSGLGRSRCIAAFPTKTTPRCFFLL